MALTSARQILNKKILGDGGPSADVQELKVEVAALSASVLTIGEKVENISEYSTIEHIIGKWIDGSDIYERVYSGSDVSSIEITTANSWYETSIDVSFVDTFIGGTYIDNNKQYFPMAAARKSAAQTMNISIPIANRECSAIILRYTKTTPASTKKTTKKK